MAAQRMDGQPRLDLSLFARLSRPPPLRHKSWFPPSPPQWGIMGILFSLSSLLPRLHRAGNPLSPSSCGGKRYPGWKRPLRHNPAVDRFLFFVPSLPHMLIFLVTDGIRRPSNQLFDLESPGGLHPARATTAHSRLLACPGEQFPCPCRPRSWSQSAVSKRGPFPSHSPIALSDFSSSLLCRT